jgi:hypothetical protein
MYNSLLSFNFPHRELHLSLLELLLLLLLKEQGKPQLQLSLRRQLETSI